MPERGTPLLWQGEADATPRLGLKALASERRLQALGGSLLLLVLMMVILLLASSPGLLPRVYALWPEQVLALGGLSWLTTGLTVVVLFLVVLGLCGRRRRLCPIIFIDQNGGGCCRKFLLFRLLIFF